MSTIDKFNELAQKRTDTVVDKLRVMEPMTRKSYKDAGDEERQPFINDMLEAIERLEAAWEMPRRGPSAGPSTISIDDLNEIIDRWFDAVPEDVDDAELAKAEELAEHLTGELNEDAPASAPAEEQDDSFSGDEMYDDQKQERGSPVDDDGWAPDDIEAVRAAAARFGMVLVDKNEAPAERAKLDRSVLQLKADRALSAIEEAARAATLTVRALGDLDEGTDVGAVPTAAGNPINPKSWENAVKTFGTSAFNAARAQLMTDKEDRERTDKAYQQAKKTLLNIGGVQYDVPIEGEPK